MPIDSGGKITPPKEGDEEIYCYCNSDSFKRGDAVTVHISAQSAESKCELKVEMETHEGRQTKYEASDITVELQAVGDNSYEEGCGWPSSHSFSVAEDWSSGFYIVTAFTLAGAAWEAYFVVRPGEDCPRADLLLCLSTSTWNAYNNWGGASAYQGFGTPWLWFKPDDERAWKPPLADLMAGSPILSILRPSMRGLISTPKGMPRTPHPPPFGLPHKKSNEREEYDKQRMASFKTLQGTGVLQVQTPFALSSGWASFESHWFCWARRNGYTIDMISNRDLHLYGKDVLVPYKCVVIAGHDEYWSWVMRDAIDAYIDSGGNLARFSGNFTWQVRFEENATKQICYKNAALENDPVVGTDKQHLTTFSWEHKFVARPGCWTFGLNASQGIYAREMGNNPRCAGGFNVYCPKHPIFAGTDLMYGDMFGQERCIFGFEVDGLSYTFKDGLPFPTGEDGAPTDGSLQILAMGLAHNGGHPTEQRFVSVCRYGDESAENLAKAERGSGMMVEYKRGKGTVIHCGTCEWVNGLMEGVEDLLTDMITKNIIEYLLNAEARDSPDSMPKESPASPIMSSTAAGSGAAAVKMARSDAVGKHDA